MSAPIIDTAIFIDVLRNKTEAKDYVLATAPSGLSTHDTVVGELIMGIRDKDELVALEKLLAPFLVLHVSEEDSALASTLLRQFKLSHSTG